MKQLVKIIKEIDFFVIKRMAGITVVLLFLSMTGKTQNSTGMPAGNIGIGTGSPANLLHVHNATPPANTVGALSEIANFSNDVGNLVQFKFLLRRHTLNGQWESMGSRLQFVTDVTHQGYLEFNPVGDPYGLAIGTGAIELMRFRQNGNIGIGTDAPWAKMDVRTPGDDNAINIQNPSAGAYATVSMTLGSGSASFSKISAQRKNLSSGSSLLFQTTDNGGSIQPRMWISDAGNVGINTTEPAEKLDVQGVAKAVTFLSGRFAYSATDNFTYEGQSIGHYALTWGADSWSGAPTAWFSSYGGIKFFTAGQPKMSIGINGNVGIGSLDISSMDYKLYVETGIRTRKIKVDQVSWADYVFDKDYRLPTLQEVERFIQQNKHLPDVPSAKEIETDGLDLGNNQAILLKKIEELTLYIIEQNKRIESLEKQMAQKQSTRL